MTWSYHGNPQGSEIDAIRFEIGDTDENWQLLQDEEIQYAVSMEANWIGAAARCCEAIARKFAREADYRLGPQWLNASQRSQAYKELAAELRRRAAALGGISHETERHLRPPAFGRGLMDNKGAGDYGQTGR